MYVKNDIATSVFKLNDVIWNHEIEFSKLIWNNVSIHYICTEVEFLGISLDH